MKAYDIGIMSIQETHLTTTYANYHLCLYVPRNRTYQWRDGKTAYTLYYSGRQGEGRTGVGIAVMEDKKYFTPVSDRLCIPINKITGINRDIIMIISYAIRLPNGEKHPELRNNFYNTLEYLIKLVNNITILFVEGDFNAETGSGCYACPVNMGRFRKGELSTNRD